MGGTPSITTAMQPMIMAMGPHAQGLQRQRGIIQLGLLVFAGIA
jgi:hypothetical protein